MVGTVGKDGQEPFASGRALRFAFPGAMIVQLQLHHKL